MAYSLPADLLSAGVAPVAAPAAPLRLSAGDRPSAIARQAITEFGGGRPHRPGDHPFLKPTAAIFLKFFQISDFLVRRQSYLVHSTITTDLAPAALTSAGSMLVAELAV